ncbi:MAG TPA: fumarylacetoacetate hydrolase family protein [Alphaproteobacteria bacterium]|nr:fumarylacetoacetate hydrolase family protein [Alphaproteobacteria bacterium]
MRDEELHRSAAILGQARASGRRLTDWPAQSRPQTLEEGYAIQRQLISGSPGRVRGWKLACTSAELQRRYRVTEPYFGPLFETVVFDSSARIGAAEYAPCGVECEFAFELGADITASRRELSVADVASAVASVRPAIEVVSSRFVNWKELDAPSVIADCASNGALIIGHSSPIGLAPDLATHPVTLTIDGRESAKGTGAAVLGHPLNALRWLINSRSRWFDLKAGDLITTGSATGLIYTRPGNRVTGEFGTLGHVEFTVT